MAGRRSSGRSSLEEFAGTDRFEIMGRLGAGGMGVVYEALDHSTQSRVALKTLSLADATSIYRFKKEFRGLSDISHPNLVALYELILGEEEEQWFFTMELVRGTDLLSCVRGGAIENETPTEAMPTEALSQEDMCKADTEPVLTPDPRKPSAPRNVELVRSTMVQLVEGLHALHLAGRLHRDVKPTNILVSEEHRVVLVDFGLSTRFAEVDTIVDRLAVGTVAYMSPEQAAQGVLGPASDWYSVGCVLYELLTGVLPFVGPGTSVLLKKQEHQPDDPRTLVSGLPDDLCDLCVALLRCDPGSRPGGVDILRRLGGSKDEFFLPLGAAGSSSGDVFVGRNEHLRRLSEVFSSVAEVEEPRCVLIHGSPGIGKTALVKRFTEQVRHEHDTVILSGRCYERESVPFKAVDTIVDALSRYLGGLGRAEVRELLPPHTHALTRLFPVLKAVRAIARMKGAVESVDPQVARRRALEALRSLLYSVAEKQSLIVRIDDLQWGDADSVVFLASLLAPPRPPKLLLLISYRRDDVETSEALQVLLERLEDMSLSPRVHFLPLDRLSEQEAIELTRARIGGMRGEQIDSLLRRVAAESDGSPFFVEEMMRYLQHCTVTTGDSAQTISLRETMLARVDSLSPEQRRLLEVVAVAGTPITEEIAFRASGMTANDGTVVSVLRAGRLVRSNREGVVAKLESYHDRIRELLVEEAGPQQLEETYRALACAFEVSASADSESIAGFYARAGDVDAAAKHALVAAERAEDALAFGRAALYYRMALQSERPKDEMLRLRMKLAEALSNAGKGQEAGLAHLDVAESAPTALALDQRRQAAESFLRAGHVDRAVELFKGVLADVGLSFPTTNRRALLNLLWWRMYLRIRGVSFRERDASQVRPDQLIKVDVCSSCGLGFGVNDSFRGAEFQTRQVILALRAGEPGRVGLGLALEAAYRSLDGKKGRAAATSLIARSRELGERVANPVVIGVAQFSEALGAYQCGEWRQALHYFDEAAQILVRDCRGQQANACQAERLAVDALFFLGDVKEFSQRVPGVLQAAEERGDLHGATDMRTGSPNAVWLVDDQPQQARLHCERGEKQWSERRFFLQHYYAALAHINIDLYEGQGARALERCDAMWMPLKRSFLLRVAVVGAQATFLQGRSLIAAANESSVNENKSGTREILLKRACKLAKKLRRQSIGCAAPWSDLVRAQVFVIRGQPAQAIELLRNAREALQEQNMVFCFHSCSQLLGSLLGDAEGERMQKEAQQWATSQGIVKPSKFLRIMAPLA